MSKKEDREAEKRINQMGLIFFILLALAAIYVVSHPSDRGGCNTGQYTTESC